MKNLSITAYEYDELSPEAKENAVKVWREKYPDYPEYDWYDFEFEYWKEKLEELGYNDANISFSGFWSQGDGASFTAKLDSEIIKNRFLKDDEKELLKNCIIYGEIYRTSNHYSHKYTVDCRISDIDYSNEIYDMEDDDEDKYREIVDRIDGILRDIEDFILVDARNLMTEIYDELEKEYEYLTSDEQIGEMISCNGCEFTEKGELIPYWISV